MQLHGGFLFTTAVAIASNAVVVTAIPSHVSDLTTAIECKTDNCNNNNNKDTIFDANINISNVHNTGKGSIVGVVQGSFTTTPFTNTNNGIRYRFTQDGARFFGIVSKHNRYNINYHGKKLVFECDDDGVVTGLINDTVIAPVIGNRQCDVDITVYTNGEVRGRINGVWGVRAVERNRDVGCGSDGASTSGSSTQLNGPATTQTSGRSNQDKKQGCCLTGDDKNKTTTSTSDPVATSSINNTTKASAPVVTPSSDNAPQVSESVAAEPSSDSTDQVDDHAGCPHCSHKDQPTSETSDAAITAPSTGDATSVGEKPANHAKDTNDQPDGTDTGAASISSGFRAVDLTLVVGAALAVLHL